MAPIQLIVGLGNPGSQYTATRHNAGFWWVDALAQKLGVTLRDERGMHGLVARASMGAHTVWLLQPQTFMNASGRAVAALARFYKIAPEAILVAHDELDLPPGQARLKLGGGAAGHNGLRDITAQLGTDGYARLRLGIGHPGDKSEVLNWVLRKPSLDERIAIDQALDRACAALPHLLGGDTDAATRLIHTTKPERPKPPRPAQATTRSDPTPAAPDPGH